MRAAALAFLAATLAARPAHDHDLGTAPTRTPAAADSNPGCPESKAVCESMSMCADSIQHKSRADAHALASTSNRSCRVASSPDLHAKSPAGHQADQQTWHLLLLLLKVTFTPARTVAFP